MDIQDDFSGSTPSGNDRNQQRFEFADGRSPCRRSADEAASPNQAAPLVYAQRLSLGRDEYQLQVLVCPATRLLLSHRLTLRRPT